MNVSTPALLFPAISLLLLAYTNRFLVLAQLIRQLHGQRNESSYSIIRRQIVNLKKRIFLIKTMQALGVFSFILCAISMFLFFHELIISAKILFGLSLISLVLSLLFSLYEIIISTNAISIELEDLDEHIREPDEN